MSLLPHWNRALLIAALLCCGCDSKDPVAASWPAGTALVINGIALDISDVDEHIDALLDIKPAWSLTQRRRTILMHWSFPMLYGQSLAGEKRVEALQEAQEWLAGPEVGPVQEFGPGEPDLDGNWDQIGVQNWILVRDLEPGETSGVVEVPGMYAVFHMQARDHAINPAHESMQLVVKKFPYYDDPDKLPELVFDGQLEIVDPAWREIVPAPYKYKMRGER